LKRQAGASGFPPLASVRLERQLQIQSSKFQQDILHFTLFRKQFPPGINDGDKMRAISQERVLTIPLDF
jgi:hypothetical protein